MSDLTDDLDDQPTGDSGGPRELREALKAARAAEQEAKRAAAEAQQELEQTRRQQAFAAAGIDVNSPAGKFFAEKYDGPLEDLASAAAELGLVSAPAQPATSQAEQQAWAQVGASPNAGAVPATVNDVNSTLKFGDSPQVIAEKLRRAGQPVDNVTMDASSGGVWLGRPPA